MEITKETKRQYLTVLKALLPLSDPQLVNVAPTFFADILCSTTLTNAYKMKLDLLKLRNALQEKIDQLEVLSAQFPELMDLPLEEEELIAVEKLA